MTAATAFFLLATYQAGTELREKVTVLAQYWPSKTDTMQGLFKQSAISA